MSYLALLNLILANPAQWPSLAWLFVDLDAAGQRQLPPGPSPGTAIFSTVYLVTYTPRLSLA